METPQDSGSSGINVERDDPGTHLRGTSENIDLTKINDYSYEMPKQGGMRVPGLIFANANLIEKIKKDMTLKQIMNVAHLPGIIDKMIAMPDCHQGYGFPIGGVAAFDIEEGIISPGGVGYDINCGVRLITTKFTFDEVEKVKQQLLDQFYKEVPPGVGRPGLVKIGRDTMHEVVQKGAEWAIENGYGTPKDLQTCEEYGRMHDADFNMISQRAFDRGFTQLGTLGSGNHFLELQKVGKIFDPKTAKAFGITDENQVVVMVHCGSRGFGHQVASDYIKIMEDHYGTKHLPDRELVCAPIKSDHGEKYYKAMCGAVNFAFCNRQLITHWIRDSFAKVMGSSDGMSLVYDVCHNIAKIEKHHTSSGKRDVCVHRKGATRSFGPGRSEIPDHYRDIGQPVLIPGSMGTSSYVLLGKTEAENVSFGSTPHGAGRSASRSEALRTVRGEDIKRQLLSQGIVVKAASNKGVAEEAPQFYKDVDEVVKVSHEAGIGTMVVQMKPIGVVKG